MASKKVLVVFGATGVQGGSVVKAFLGDSKLRDAWTVRGVTRDISKPSAKALEAQGAETIAVSPTLGRNCCNSSSANIRVLGRLEQ
jgi:uncharacterized protein YbjT (DUF2867 family)